MWTTTYVYLIKKIEIREKKSFASEIVEKEKIQSKGKCKGEKSTSVTLIRLNHFEEKKSHPKQYEPNKTNLQSF